MTDTPIHRIEQAADVDEWISRVYGADGEAPHLGTGILHPTSVWRPPTAEGERELQLTLRIGPETPLCALDTFALNLCRARADAILTTGRILRQEPELRHELGGPGGMPKALADWRRRRGKTRPPVTLVLSRSGEIDLDHPLFTGPGRAVIYTSTAGAWKLESRAADAGVEVEETEQPTPEGALDFLRSAFGAATLSIEAGPSVSRQYYRPKLLVDELLLSTFSASHLATSVRGGRQLTRPEIKRLFQRTAPPFQLETPEGVWSFERFVRR